MHAFDRIDDVGAPWLPPTTTQSWRAGHPKCAVAAPPGVAAFPFFSASLVTHRLTSLFTSSSPCATGIIISPYAAQHLLKCSYPGDGRTCSKRCPAEDIAT